jgi:hypothetical protein
VKTPLWLEVENVKAVELPSFIKECQREEKRNKRDEPDLTPSNALTEHYLRSAHFNKIMGRCRSCALFAHFYYDRKL